ncbi:MAG: ABC transporter ATP-binding protein [Candidatus Heimdallarchaeota archaeon]|nr:MAG: ABC transporter ATP-binding protein [Candidatus Heimdallarchaeota archaeon]
MELENVNQRYTLGGHTIDALNSINLSIFREEFIMVMGPSGSGKSTLINVMAGLERPSAGTVHIDQEELSTLSDRELCQLRRHKLGFVFQFFNLHPVLNALENVELPMLISGIKRADREPRALELLRLVNLENRKHHQPHELSGGEKQRVGIARSLANDPDVILADEPTGDLDSAIGSEIMSLLSSLNKTHKKTIVCVTHDEEMLKTGMRLIKMEDGYIISDSYL